MSDLRTATARLDAWCRSRAFPFVCAIVAVLLASPAASNGLQTEDRLQRLAGWTFHVYSHGSGDVLQNYSAKDAGFLPWVASDDLRVSFFRPLASLSLAFDYQVLPANGAWPYAQSFLWLAVLVGAASALFRRLNATWGAGALAAVLFAFDDARAMSVGWLAARHSLMAAALSAVALLFFDGWRRGSKLAGYFCSLVLLLALLASELAASALGFFVAYTLFLDGAPVRRRLLAALAYLAPTGVWLAAYLLGGYGARGSGMYISPIDEPLQAAKAVLFRAPWLLTGTLGVGPADLGNLIPEESRVPWSIFAWLIALGILAFLSPIIRRSATGWFWLVGLLLSSIPLCTGPAGDRLLLLLPLSGMAFVDLLVAGLVQRVGSRLWRIAGAALSAFWLLVHGLLAPLLVPSAVRRLAGPDEWIVRGADSACAGVRADQQLVILQTPDYYFGGLLAGLAKLRGCRASHVRVLFGGLETPRVERLDERTLLVHADRGFLDGMLNRAFRSESRRFALGQGLQLSDLQIVIVGITESGAPKDVEFRFAWPLEHQRFRFVAWNGERYVPVELPLPGKQLRMTAFVPTR